jgi:hypothetical protein
MVPITTIPLIIGLVGVLVIIVFAIANGIGNGTLGNVIVHKERCPVDKEVEKAVPYRVVTTKSSYKLSNIIAAGSCPTGYTYFTDSNGISLCCASSNIDIYSRTCAASGAESICAMSPGISDTRNPDTHYPECKKISLQQQQRMSGKLCPMAYPNYATTTGAGYKCCAGPLAAGGTDCLAGSSCMGLNKGQNIFNTPSSCEKSLLLENTTCPSGTHMVPNLKGTSKKTRDLNLPVCVGVHGNCMPRGVLNKLRMAGYFTDIDFDKNIINCDVFNKVYNDRLLDISQVDLTKSADL